MKYSFFAKGHALGNNFVLIHTNKKPSVAEVINIAHRKTGLGCDQLLTISDDFNVNIWNGDGSTAKMCGNGLKTLAKWLFMPPEERGIFQDIGMIDNITLTISSGNVQLETCGNEIKMRLPIQAKIEEKDGEFFVDIANMHKISILKRNPDDLSKYASKSHNASCIWLENERWYARTWELGAGETLACGSAAFAIASILESRGEKNLDVHFPLGTIKHIKDNEQLVQIGPANIVGIGRLCF